MASLFDELGMHDETDSERLARDLADADAAMIAALRRVRTHLGLSQKELGDRLGITQASVSDFESDGSEAKLSTIRRYAHALGATIRHEVVRDEFNFVAADQVAVTWQGRSTLGNALSTQPATLLQFSANAKRTDFALSA